MSLKNKIITAPVWWSIPHDFHPPFKIGDCLCKTWESFLRCFGYVVGFPLDKQLIVVDQDTKGMIPALLEFLRFVFLPNISLPKKILTVIH